MRSLIRLLSRPHLWIPVVRARLSLELFLLKASRHYGVPHTAARAFLGETRQLKAFAEAKLERLNGKFPGPGRGCLDGPYAQALYILTRLSRPSVVIETGVANGYSSLFILHALAKNDHGHLYSVKWDESGQYLPAGLSAGWLVPNEIRSRWEIIAGRSQDVLVPLIHRQPRVDLFLHDSDHSRENQSFELSAAAGKVSDGGCIVCDDIQASDAFDRLASAPGDLKLTLNSRLGILARCRRSEASFKDAVASR